MPANSRWDLIQRLKVKQVRQCARGARPQTADQKTGLKKQNNDRAAPM